MEIIAIKMRLDKIEALLAQAMKMPPPEPSVKVVVEPVEPPKQVAEDKSE
jgi:hypothetical protein